MQPLSHQPGGAALETQSIPQESGPVDAPATHSRGGGAMLVDSAQPIQSNGVLVGHSNRPVYFQDALIISRLKPALIKGGAAGCTAGNNVNNLLTLDRWLFENKKGTIAARLDDQSLRNDVEEFIKAGGTNKVRTALDHLRTSEIAGGVVPIAGVVKLTPYPEDAALIRQFKNETRTATGRNNATALTRLSDYLREKNKPSIAGRLSDKSLDNDVGDYKKRPGYDRSIGYALGRLRQSQAGTQVMEVERHIPRAPYSQDAVLTGLTCTGDVATQHSLSEVAISWPEVLRAECHDEDLPLGWMDEPDLSSPFQSSTQVGASPAGEPLIVQQSVQDHSSTPYEDGGTMLGTSPAQSARSAAAYVDGSMPPLYSDDASLILGLGETVVGSNREPLLNLARWLFASDKPGIVARLHDDSLSRDVEEFERSCGSSSVVTTLALLRAPRSANVAPPRVRRVLNPYPEDAALVYEYKKAPAEGYTRETSKRYATLLADFSAYLRNKKRPGIAAQLSGRSPHELDKDVEGYQGSGGERKIRTALAHFLKSPAGVRVRELERQFCTLPDLGVVPAEPGHVGDDASHHSAWLRSVSSAEVHPAEGYDQDLGSEMMDEAGPSSALEPTAKLAASLPERQPIAQASAGEYAPTSQEGRAARASSLQSGQSAWAFVGRIGDPLYSRDASLIDRLRPALIKRGFKPRTITDNVNALLRFGRWLLKNKKPEIATRLNHESLDEDTKAFDKTPNQSILRALGHLRASQSESGGPPIAGREELTPYDNDAALIKEYKATATKSCTTSEYTNALSKFSEYLRRSNKPEFAARLYNKSLDEDVTAYRKEPGSYRRIGAALSHLRESPTCARAIELEEPREEVVINDERDTQDTAELTLAENTGASEDSRAVPAERQLGGSDYLGGRTLQAGRGQVAAETASQHGAAQRPFNWPEELPPGEYDHSLPEQTSMSPAETNDQMFLEYAASGYQAHGRGDAVEHRKDSHEPLHALDTSNLPSGEGVMINYEGRTVDFAPAKRRKILSPQSLATTSHSASEVVTIAGAFEGSAYPDDATLIKDYKMQAAIEGTSSRAKGYASVLIHFSRYLRQNKKRSITAQLNDTSVSELNHDANRYREAGGYRAVNAALADLRDGGSKRVPAPLYSEDASLIAGLEPALIGAGYEAITAKTQYVRPLRRFSRWLVANRWPGIAARLDDGSLDRDAAAFEKGRKRPTVPTALDRLRDFRSERGIASITVRRRNVLGLDVEHNWPEKLPPESDDHDLLWGIEEDGPSYGVPLPERTQQVEQASREEPAGSTSTWSLRVPSDFDWSMWPAKEAEPSLPVAAQSPSTPQEVEQAPREEPAGSTSTWSLQVPSDFDWSMWPAGEAEPSLPHAAQSPSTPYELRDDAHYAFPRSPTNALLGTSTLTVSIHGPGGQLLDDMEWLGDEHIAADYALLLRDLHKHNSDLAARTRLVDPATAHVLRRTLNEDVLLEHLHGIVNDQDGNDTARFLFLPVNDDEGDGGHHWSLLFLDRDAPEGPVAYHYDSAEGRNHTHAAKLAEVLHARLERRPIAQQRNSYDCGVYVADGTRELVSQLSQGRRPELLNLDNLVASRRALQNRLRGRPR